MQICQYFVLFAFYMDERFVKYNKIADDANVIV